MALSIEAVTIHPHPIPASGAHVRAECRITSGLEVKSVSAYPPMGEAVQFRDRGENRFTAEEYVPPGQIPGTYEVVVVATDVSGNTARKMVSVTLE